MHINEDFLEIIPLNPLLAKEHMNLYREGQDYLDHHLELGELFHLYSFITTYRYRYFEINNKIVIKNIPVIMVLSLINIVTSLIIYALS